MTTQLTLTLDTAVLAQAQAAARAAGLDLAAFIEKLVQEALPPPPNTDDLPPLPPAIQALRGILPLSDEEFQQLRGAARLSPADTQRDYKDLAGEERMKKYLRLDQ